MKDADVDHAVAAAPPMLVFADKEGRFETPKLPPRTYEVTFVRDGFKQEKIDKVIVTCNQDRDLGLIHLEPERH